MITSRWFKGNEELAEIIELRKEIFGEDSILDFYDEFSFNLGIYEDEKLAGIGRLLSKKGKFFIDNFGVKKIFRNKYYGDFMIRILIRKAYDMGIEKIYIECKEDTAGFYEKLGFKEEKKEGNKRILFREGDITSGCC